MINLLSTFRARAVESRLFRHDDIHHTPAGAAVFADGIVSGLLSAHVLPECLKRGGR